MTVNFAVYCGIFTGSTKLGNAEPETMSDSNTTALENMGEASSDLGL